MEFVGVGGGYSYRHVSGSLKVFIIGKYSMS